MTAHTFLAELYRDFEDGWLTLFSIDRTTGDRHTDWAHVTDLEQLATVAATRAETSCVWFGAATRTERLTTGRGGGADCAQIPGLWLDIDIAGPTHATTNPLPPDVDAALALVADFGIPPTAIVHTGGGIQPWWCFNEPLDASDALRILPRWGHTWGKMAETRGWHLDNVFDLSRIMRLPGTTNRKADPRPVTILEADWGHRVGYDDLDQFLSDPPPPAAPATTRTVPYIGPERPGDAYNARHGGADVLAALGFTHHRTDRNGDQHWHWPGAANDTSATVYADDGHVTLWSETFTAANPPAQIRRPYDPYGLLVAARYGGDHSAAAADLRAKGYGGDAGDDDLSWVPTIPATDADWPTPTPLDPDGGEVPPFPTHTLPDWMRDYVDEITVAFQVPSDLPASIALGVMSILAMGRARIAVTGSEWNEPLNLFLAVAMPPGAGKSPVFKALTKPLQELEDRLRKGARTDTYAAEERRRQLEQRITKAQKADDGDPLEIAKMRAQLDDLPVPAEPRLLAEDVTPEALVELLAAHGGRMALISDEGGVFDMMAGQYAGQGKAANLSVYLQGWSGGTIRRDRRSTDSAMVKEALLGVCVATQPSVLARIADNPELAGRGLTARFMYAVPRSLVGYRDRSAVFYKVDGGAKQRYLDQVADLGWALAGNATTATMGLTAEAAHHFVKVWDQGIEERQRPDGDLYEMAEWCSKLRASVLRTAALLHLAEGYEPRDPVGMDHLLRAIEIGTYWIGHARAVHDLWHADQSLNRARTVLEWAVRHDSHEFSVRDVYRARKGAFAAPDDVLPALAELLERGWIVPLDGWPVQVGQRGKPSPRFRLHPEAGSLVGRGVGRTAYPPVGTGEKLSPMSPMAPKGSLSSSSSSSLSPSSTDEIPGDMGDMSAMSHHGGDMSAMSPHDPPFVAPPPTPTADDIAAGI